MTGPRTAVTTACPRCGAPTVRTPDGRYLEPAPDPLAIHLPDGGQLDWRTAVLIITGHAPPAGHHAHRPGPYGCNFELQPTLF